jgi:LCP family protein required for cell wall assembly
VLRRVAVVAVAGTTLLGLAAWWTAERTVGAVRRDGAVTAALSPLPGGGQPVTVLLVGSDRREGLDVADDRFGLPGTVAGERADALVLVQVPAAGPLRALSLPRDLLVDLDGFGPQKLAAALDLGGSRLLVRAVRSVTGLPVHHYAAVDFAGFAAAVDRLGGVVVEFPAPARDPYAGLDVGAGRQRLDGDGALAFVRARNLEEWRGGEWVPAGGGDLGRIERQHRLLQAGLAEAARLPAVSTARWLAAVGPHLTVDARLGFAGLRRLAARVGAEPALEAATLPVRPLVEEAAARSPFAPDHPGTIRYLVPDEPAAAAAVEGLR